jgi:hypothetical protein
MKKKEEEGCRRRRKKEEEGGVVVVRCVCFVCEREAGIHWATEQRS